jgi:hypothetical protein
MAVARRGSDYQHRIFFNLAEKCLVCGGEVDEVDEVEGTVLTHTE